MVVLVPYHVRIVGPSKWPWGNISYKSSGSNQNWKVLKYKYLSIHSWETYTEYTEEGVSLYKNSQ